MNQFTKDIVNALVKKQDIAESIPLFVRRNQPRQAIGESGRPGIRNIIRPDFPL
ncbi:hypothetical protein [Jeotgalibacillus soli]|uniref:Uncharacterized protein n=1 Tax=Jeotgalibacillus soli TaxID=889306 RepID=A0A0C2W5D9_9BACL|nr:hypothetical protein [Jeotgalibacillus soli]KIL51801.1 hypothetical protein KP78_01710 [Jeotgalibacillus soli]